MPSRRAGACGIAFDPNRERAALGRGRVVIDDLIDAAGCLLYFFLPARLAAQYFFIRSETAAR